MNRLQALRIWVRPQRSAERDDAAGLSSVLVLQDHLDGVVVHQFGACAHGVEQATIAERSYRPCGTLRDLVIAFTATGFSAEKELGVK